MSLDGVRVAWSILSTADELEPLIGTGSAARIYSRLPSAGPPAAGTRWLFLRDLPIGRPRIMAAVPYVRTTIQLDAYGSSQGGSHDLAELAVAALDAARNTVHAGAILSRAEWYGLGDLPDDTLLDTAGNARARTVVSIELDLRPAA